MNPFLRECNDLQINQRRHRPTHFQHRLQSDQLQVRHVDMGTNMLDSLRHLPLQRGRGPGYYIGGRQQLLALEPSVRFPSNRVPLRFQAGSPAVSAVSR